MRDAARRTAQPGWARPALLALILLACARVFWQLGANDLWWDESLSLQRAEQPLGPLLRGHLVMYDGISSATTIDQHPFFYFLLLGGVVRSAGESEFAVRWLSAAAAVLFVPAMWLFARLFVRRGAFPAGAPLWGALLAAVSPFFLWYGQEARAYSLWAALALLCTYLLLRAVEEERLWSGWLAGYIAAFACFLATHYFSVLLLPVHALLIFLWLRRRMPWLAWLLAAGMVGGGVLLGVVILNAVLARGGGVNFAQVELDVLLPDLLNAFSMGLSVEITDVWWLDLVFGATALAGAAWALRSRQSRARAGWAPVAFVVVPVAALWLVNLFQPLYMNARHMALIAGAFLSLAGAGLAVLGMRSRWAAAALALLFVLGAGYSTWNFFTLEKYAKHNYSDLGEWLDGRVMPGDLLLLKPPFSWRIYRYYLPLDELDAAQAAGAHVAHYGVPLVQGGWDATFDRLRDWQDEYRRVWLVSSGPHNYLDPENRVDEWLHENLFLLEDKEIGVKLFLPELPVYDTLPAGVEQPLDVVFGGQMRLAGLEQGPLFAPDLAVPVSLYWQAVEKRDDRYKYLLRLVGPGPDGAEEVLAVTEREPYDGLIPTNLWDPGKTILEYSELPPLRREWLEGRYRLALQVYHADTLEKLPATASGPGAEVDPDGVTVWLPFHR